MKYLFLDVDGVLNHNGSAWIDDACLERLRRVLDETSAMPVLSSDWKSTVLHPELSREYEVRMVDDLLHGLGLEFAGVTPDLGTDDRELEVAAWLDDAHGPVDAFVILDDLDFGFEDMFPGHFVKTSGLSGGGLTDEQADIAIEILNA